MATSFLLKAFQRSTSLFRRPLNPFGMPGVSPETLDGESITGRFSRLSIQLAPKTFRTGKFSMLISHLVEVHGTLYLRESTSIDLRELVTDYSGLGTSLQRL